MRAYSASSEEALRARDLLKDWAGEGFLTAQQHQHMEQETLCELRRTNIFLRLVLFFFTLLIVGAGVGLFFVIFLSKPAPQATGIFLLIWAVILYAAAEFAVSEGRFYRHGIEEALAVCAVGFLLVGLHLLLVRGRPYSPRLDPTEFLVPAAGVIASVWIWRRFGFSYAFLAAMIFVLPLPGYLTSSHSAQHLIVAAFYATGLAMVAAIRSRYRFTFLNVQYSIAEALLWLGIYLAFNLQLSPVNLGGHWLARAHSTAEFAATFYWTTWMLIWCIPPGILARGFRGKDRFVIAVGGIGVVLTLITNKPYLGWQRHTWDPMLLGALLIGVALFIRRWLASGAGGTRHGFTAMRLSGKDKHWMDTASAVFSLASPQSMAQSPQPGSPGVQFGGGDSGGGGATSDF